MNKTHVWLDFRFGRLRKQLNEDNGATVEVQIRLIYAFLRDLRMQMKAIDLDPGQSFIYDCIDYVSEFYNLLWKEHSGLLF